MAHDAAVPPVVADSLALAVVTSSDAPTLLLDGDLTVLAASASFLRAFQIERSGMEGKPLFECGAGEWDLPQLRSLLRLTLAGENGPEVSEMDLTQRGVPSRRVVVTVHRLCVARTVARTNVWLLLAASDVTDARLAVKLKDDLLREKAVLQQELLHRVANSLQIIASILMQSARRVPSDDARSYLLDAHSRIMSVATLQQQLAQSRVGDVALRAYFTELCATLGASLIQKHETMSIEVEADDGQASAEVSASLGLIVTELVINALKHASPDGRGGSITVAYSSSAPDWKLVVSDDGIGNRAAAPKAWLGTNIVEALAKQVGAVVEVAEDDRGTRVSIIHNKNIGLAVLRAV